MSIDRNTAHRLAKSLLGHDEDGSWVDELTDTEEQLTEWLEQWFMKDSKAEEAAARVALEARLEPAIQGAPLRVGEKVSVYFRHDAWGYDAVVTERNGNKWLKPVDKSLLENINCQLEWNDTTLPCSRWNGWYSITRKK